MWEGENEIWRFCVALILLIVNNVVGGAFMWSMWSRRRELLVRARSPAMCMLLWVCCQVAAYTVLGNEMLVALGSRLPCQMWIPISFFCSLGTVIGITVRALNVIIFSNKHYRDKLGWVIRPTTTLIIACTLLGSHFLASIFILVLTPQPIIDDKLCYMLEPAEYILTLMVASTAFAAFLIKKLFEAKDRLGMGIETIRMYMYYYILPGPYMVLLILADRGIIEKRYSYQWLIYFLNVCILLETFVFSRSRWIHKLGPVGPRSVVPVNSGNYGTCLDFIPVPVLASAFANFVEKSLCIESWKFILDAKVYSETNFTTEQDHYKEFVVLLNTYIYQRSPYEINIDTKMRVAVEVYAKVDAFMALDARGKYHVFDDSVKEITKMLDQNIFTSFLKTPVFAEANQKLIDAMAGEDGGSTQRLVAESLQEFNPKPKSNNDNPASSLGSSQKQSFSPLSPRGGAPMAKTHVAFGTPPQTPSPTSRPAAAQHLSKTISTTSASQSVPPSSSDASSLARSGGAGAHLPPRGGANKKHNLGLDFLEEGPSSTQNPASSIPSPRPAGAAGAQGAPSRPPGSPGSHLPPRKNRGAMGLDFLEEASPSPSTQSPPATPVAAAQASAAIPRPPGSPGANLPPRKPRGAMGLDFLEESPPAAQAQPSASVTVTATTSVAPSAAATISRPAGAPGSHLPPKKQRGAMGLDFLEEGTSSPPAQSPATTPVAAAAPVVSSVASVAQVPVAGPRPGANLPPRKPRGAMGLDFLEEGTSSPPAQSPATTPVAAPVVSSVASVAQVPAAGPRPGANLPPRKPRGAMGLDFLEESPPAVQAQPSAPVTVAAIALVAPSVPATTSRPAGAAGAHLPPKGNKKHTPGLDFLEEGTASTPAQSPSTTLVVAAVPSVQAASQAAPRPGAHLPPKGNKKHTLGLDFLEEGPPSQPVSPAPSPQYSASVPLLGTKGWT